MTADSDMYVFEELLFRSLGKRGRLSSAERGNLSRYDLIRSRSLCGVRASDADTGRTELCVFFLSFLSVQRRSRRGLGVFRFRTEWLGRTSLRSTERNQRRAAALRLQVLGGELRVE